MTMFEKTRMPFQTDVFAVRAPYSVEGARFRDSSIVPSLCLLARRDFFSIY